MLATNIFYGHDFHELLGNAMQREQGASVLAYHVHDPERYGVAEFDAQGVEPGRKAPGPKSNYAVTGLYFYDNQVVELAKSLKPSAAANMKSPTWNRLYLEQAPAQRRTMGPWLRLAGTPAPTKAC